MYCVIIIQHISIHCMATYNKAITGFLFWSECRVWTPGYSSEREANFLQSLSIYRNFRYSIMLSRHERSHEHSQQGHRNHAAQQKEQGRTRPVVLLSLLVFCLIAAIGFVIWQNGRSQSGPLQTLTRYCQALKDLNYSLAYAQLDSSMQRQETLQAFTDQIGLLGQGRGRLSNCTIDDGMQEQTSSANGHITLSFADGSTLRIGVVLKNDHSSWKIRYFVQIAYLQHSN